MTRRARLRASVLAAWRGFLRRRTAVFFTFLFPFLIVVIFGALVQTRPTGGGLFAREPAYYVPGYLAVVVLFTPLSRVGSEVARHRRDNRFEKLATTPLSRPEWLLAQALVNVLVIGTAALALLVALVALTGAELAVSAASVAAVAAGVVLAVGLFCGIGAALGSIADSQDGVVAASNGLAVPLLFLSETFVPPAMLPAWFRPAMAASPLTYFSRAVRTATYSAAAGSPWVDLGILAVLAVASVAVGASLLPRTD